MNTRSNTAAVVAYITWIGFIYAIITGDRTDRFTMTHINQALVLNLIGIVGGFLTVIPLLGTIAAWIVDMAVFAFSILGIVRAATWNDEPLPIVGEIHLIG